MRKHQGGRTGQCKDCVVLQPLAENLAEMARSDTWCDLGQMTGGATSWLHERAVADNVGTRYRTVQPQIHTGDALYTGSVVSNSDYSCSLRRRIEAASY